MKKFLSLILILAISFSCKETKESLNANFIKSEFGDDVALAFQRDACFGECPVDKIVISKKGNIYYNGRMFVENQGLYKMASSKSLEEVIGDLNQMGIKSFKKEYDGGIADLPSYRFYVNYKGSQALINAKSDYPEELAKCIYYMKNYIDGLSVKMKIEEEDFQ